MIPSVSRHFERRQPTKEVGTFVGHRRRGILQAQAREALEQRSDRDRTFHPRQRRADAKVDTLAERQVIARLARDVETIWIIELRRIAIRRRQDYEAMLIGRQIGPAQVYVFLRETNRG